MGKEKEKREGEARAKPGNQLVYIYSLKKRTT